MGTKRVNRRKDKRIQLNHPIRIAIAGSVELGTLINLSHGGALIEMEDRSTVDSGYLGETGTFMLKPIEGAVRRYTGEIIRHYVRGGHNCIVVRFWKPYTIVDDVSL